MLWIIKDSQNLSILSDMKTVLFVTENMNLERLKVSLNRATKTSVAEDAKRSGKNARKG